MNTYQVEALATFIIGRIQEDAGKIVRSSKLENAGYSRQIAAKARKAVGEADQIIKQCHQRKHQSVRAGSNGMLCDISVVN